MGKTIKVRCKQVGGLKETRLRKLGAALLYWTAQPEEVDEDDPEVRRRLHLGLLEVVDAPLLGVTPDSAPTSMVDIPRDPKLLDDRADKPNPGPKKGGKAKE